MEYEPLSEPLVARPAAEAPRSSWRSGTRFMLLCTGAGALLGVVLSAADASDDLAFWIAYPGSLFIRALKCLVVPMIFCSMVCGVAELSGLGKTGPIGSRTFLLYMSTTFLAAIEGLVFASVFKGAFSVDTADELVTGASLTLLCDNGKYLATGADGAVACSASSGSSTFVANDESGYWAEAEPIEAQSVSDTLAGIGYSLIPDNIVAAMATPDILSVIMFAIAFGLAAARIEVKDGDRNLVLDFVAQLNEVIGTLIQGAIGFAPYGVGSLIAGALADTDDFGALLKDIGLVVVAVLLGLGCHAGVTLPLVFRFMVGHSPFSYVSKCTKAYAFAFGCASSAATLPITMAAVEASGEVPPTVAKFVLSLGSVVNMDGSAIYYPVAIVFLATVSGIGDDINVGTLFVIALVSTLGAVGSSPIPNAGLIMMLTIWSSVFPGISVPSQIAYLQAMDWLLDRFVTSMNVCGDTMVARIIAETCATPSEEEFREQKQMARRMSTGDAHAAVEAALSL